MSHSGRPTIGPGRNDPPVQQTTVQDALHRAMELARAGQGEPAQRLLRDILRAIPEQPDALQLLGMLARKRGANDEAVVLFRRSLAANAGQPNVLNNLGNALLDLGRHDEAVKAYQAALALVPDYIDARTNMGLAQLAVDDATAARETLEIAVHAAPRDGKAWSALGRALRTEGRLDDAIAAFETALDIRPNNVPTMHNLAVALRLSGKPEDAISLLMHCAAADPGSAEIRYNLGHCLQDLARFDEAAQAYRDAIALRPDDRGAHDSLARLHWQIGNTADYLRSYGEVLNVRPDDAGLLSDLANRLNLGGRSADTVALLSPALARGVETGELRHRLGQALWAQGATQAAMAHFQAARELDPANDAIAREATRALIILDRPEEALMTIEPLLAGNPWDQQAIAYRALCGRLLGDPAVDALDDYERLIGSAILQPPAGMGDVEAFNARLEAVLAELHTMSTHPLEQTLRGGTQTIGDLLDRDIPEIAAVRAMIEDRIRNYIAALPDDPDHPFLARKSDDFTFTGSWSVRLRSAGFHLNHIHPEGWISSCYYVGLPHAVDTAPGNQGWLKFGETALGLGQRERIARLVRPEVGKLVLFPSYFYHGTIPFEEDRYRTTIAFDLIPA
jgi:tetratricopeptide (TPR) repeat protein